ncbi:MAG: ABC transporter ATP-binding protein [Oligoflexia bacterium]|nr:ABC transporter ATP-binding protein [Oligoflexia bacterium]
MQNSLAIEFKDLSKIYKVGFWGKKQTALEELTLSVQKNSIFGFLGANGAGKTTSIKILLGLQRQDKGECKIFGNSNLTSEVKANLGFLPERPYFHDGLTAYAFLNFHRSLYGKHLKKNIPTNDELLKLVGLSNTSGKTIRNFSKGMMQRIGIAQTLINDPELIILDEPMSGLDPVGRKEVRDIILSLKKKGKTIFFSTHILSDVENICDHFAFLEKGKLKYHGGVKDALSKMSAELEVIFSIETLPSDPLLKTAVKLGSQWMLTNVDPELINEIILKIIQNNGKIISLNNNKSLENFLFSEKEKNKI